MFGDRIPTPFREVRPDFHTEQDFMKYDNVVFHDRALNFNFNLRANVCAKKNGRRIVAP